MPILGFWIYLVWIIIILGSEVSYLVQNGRDLLMTPLWDPSLREGEAVLAVLAELWRAHQEGTNPVEFGRLRSISSLHSERLHGVLGYLQRANLVLECALAHAPENGAYALSRELSEIPVSQLLGEFFQSSRSESQVGQFWNSAVEQWIAGFEEIRISDIARDPTKKRGRKDS